MTRTTNTPFIRPTEQSINLLLPKTLIFCYLFFCDSLYNSHLSLILSTPSEHSRLLLPHLLQLPLLFIIHASLILPTPAKHSYLLQSHFLQVPSCSCDSHVSNSLLCVFLCIPLYFCCSVDSSKMTF